jgi:hypothetical protein
MIQKSIFRRNNLIYPWIYLLVHFIHYGPTKNRERNLELGKVKLNKADVNLFKIL